MSKSDKRRYKTTEARCVDKAHITSTFLLNIILVSHLLKNYTKLSSDVVVFNTFHVYTLDMKYNFVFFFW